MEKILTVIVPAYNMEYYLGKCLDSLIIDDSRLFETLEVLVVNDGSKDGTLNIARRYENQYPTVFKVIDKPNGGKGSCMNIGLSAAKGKYVKELDADDWFDKLVFCDYLSYLQCVDVDFILTDRIIVNTKGKKTKRCHFPYPKEHLLKVDDYCADLVFPTIQMHCVTYKCSKLISNEYRQTEGVSYTDQEWMFLPITFMDSFSYYSKPLYQYLVGRKGQSVNPIIFSKQIDVNLNLLYKRIDAFNKIDERSISVMKKRYLLNRLMQNICSIFHKGVVEQLYPLEKIKGFEKVVGELNSHLINDMVMSPFSKYYGMNYINYWREKGKIPFLLVVYSHIIKIARRFQGYFQA